MAFLKKIQNMLGFGYDDDDELMTADDSKTETYISAVNAVPNVANADVPLEVSNEMVLKIFDKVVEITNAAVPAYLSSSLNPEKQKKYLFDALDASVKQYLASLEAQAQNKCMALWQNERDELKREMDNQKQRARELEAKRVEINNQKLSADRQKTALAQRVHDLEANIIKLEAEKEQLEIENHSLINKAKVVSVYEADMESMRQQLNTLKDNQKESEFEAENKALKDKIEELNAEIAKLNEAFEAAKVKDEMGGTMLNDLQKRNAETVKKVQELNAQIEELTSNLAIRDARIADLQNEISEKDARIAEDAETLEAVEQIAEQIDKFEIVKSKLDEKIAALKSELKDVRHENDTLRVTIKNNIYAHAQQQKALNDEIERLKEYGNFN